MSYVIHIWDHPSPETWAQAEALQARLDGRACPPNPKFVQLAQQLREGFAPQPGDPGSAWLEGEPDGDVHEAVWALALAPAQLATVAPKLIDLALALGLTVYDGQSGEVFLPGRWRLTPEGREPLVWPEVAAAPVIDFKAVAARRLEAQVRALVLPRFAPHGFQLAWGNDSETQDRLALSRDTPLGQQRIELTLTGWADPYYADEGIKLWLYCQLDPKLPDALKAWCKPQQCIAIKFMHLPELAAFYRHRRLRPFSAEFRCDTAAELATFMGIYADWAVQHYLPLLDACQTVPGLLRQPIVEPGDGAFLVGSASYLAVAHCAGVVDLAARSQRCGQQRSPRQRVTLFQQRLDELAAFPQYVGCFASAAE